MGCVTRTSEVWMGADWIYSIYFKTIRIRYKVISEGYVGQFVGPKLRAVLKAIFQAQAPCSFQHKIQCAGCLITEHCDYFRFMIDPRTPRPWLIHIGDLRQWQGLMRKGDEKAFEMRLIGLGCDFDRTVVEALRVKPLIAIDAAHYQDIRLEFCEATHLPEAGFYTLKDLMEDWSLKIAGDLKEIFHIALETVTPLALKKRGIIDTDPQDLDFDLFLRGLFNRFRELGQNQCKIDKSAILEFTDFCPSAKDVLFNAEKIRFRGQKSGGLKKFPALGEKASKEYVGGFEGRISFEGNLAPYFPMILLAQALHIGAKTTAGFGQFRIRQVNHKPLH